MIPIIDFANFFRKVKWKRLRFLTLFGRYMRESAAVCVVIHDRKVLLMRRKKREGDPWSGDMSFPGGFMKEGEDPVTCALREFQEETGSKSTNLKVLKVLDYFHTMRIAGLKVYPVLCSAESILDIVAGDEMEYGGWYSMGGGVDAIDPIKGSCLKYGEDVVWGLTYRILMHIRNSEEISKM